MPRFEITNNYKLTMTLIVDAEDIDAAFNKADELCENAEKSQFMIQKLESNINQLDGV